jgi:holo-[acyl-carrier protein] synthase
MVIGIGTDIVNITRIEVLLVKYGLLLKNKILGTLELEKINSLPIEKQANFIAKRFAAKEALAKALGVGIGEALRFRDVNIINNNLGKPIALIQSNGLLKIDDLKIDLSISDDYPFAIAFVVISRREDINDYT